MGKELLILFALILIVIAGGLVLIYFRPSELVGVISLGFTLILAVIGVYYQFIQGPRLEVDFNRMDFMPVPRGQRNVVVAKYVASKIVDAKDAAILSQVLKELPDLKAQFESSDKKKIEDALIERLNGGLSVGVNLSKNDVAILVAGGFLPVPIHIPLGFYNGGATSATVSTLIMIMRQKNSNSKPYVFYAMNELDDDNLLRMKEKKTDADYFKKVYSGLVIAPKQSATFNIVFVPRYGDAQISAANGNLEPGDYQVQIKGVSVDGTELFETSSHDVTFTKDMFESALGGNYTVNFDLVDKHIKGVLDGAN